MNSPRRRLSSLQRIVNGARHASPVTLLLVAFFVAACVGEPPRISSQPAPKAVPITPPLSAIRPRELATARIADAAASPAPDGGWQHVAQQLEAENRQLTAERDFWKGETARYQSGLQRAVDELNRVASAASAANAQTASAAAAAAQPQARPHVWADEPKVDIYVDAAAVTGTLYNWGDGDAHGRYCVELLVNTGLAETRCAPLEVAARSQAPLNMAFGLHGSGTYVARLRIDSQ